MWHIDKGWRCASAEESHECTEKELPNGERLTGEPAGRQTWHHTAVGGTEEKGFNPANNPNPDDSIWRAQRVAAWKKQGGKVPDASWKPKGPLEHLRKVNRIE